jgi:assimilatory nitrate reductase electron transfer subunit
MTGPTPAAVGSRTLPPEPWPVAPGPAAAVPAALPVSGPAGYVARRRRHVLIVGYGMAGARLAELLRDREPAPHRLRITVCGAELDRAYNRVLLGGVLAGTLHPEQTRLHPADWYRRRQITVHRGQPVVTVTAGGVTLAGGHRIAADTVVLATGSRARLPMVPGLSGPGASTLRTLDDCRRIVAGLDGRPVAVLGGGVLGLEAARALAARGVPVTVVHPAGQPMDRQLDAAAGGVLAAQLRRLGVRLFLGARATRYRHGRGLHTDNGGLVECGSVVVTTGVTPEVRLARAAGIEVDGGVRVDDRLATSVPGIHAIGDCAAHSGAVTGFVQPAYEQAEVLADLLTGADPNSRYRGTGPVTRLKDTEIDLATIGSTGAAASGDEEVSVSDPARGRYARLVVRADRVVGAVLLGLPDAAAALTRLYDTGTPVPADRLAVLLGRAYPDAPVADADPLVCRCNTVHTGQLVAAYEAGATDVTALAAATRATTGCGGCTGSVAGLLARLDARNTEEVVA